MDTSCQGAYSVDQQQQLSTLYDPQVPTTSYEQQSSLPNHLPQPQPHHPVASYYDSSMSHYPAPRMPYPSISVPNSPMRTQIKCEAQQQSQQPLPQSQSQYPERMITPVDNRKIMNTQAWMNDHHRFVGYPQQQQQQQQQYRTGSAPSSVMSVSRMSHVSTATEDMSMLSVNTQITELRQLADLVGKLCAMLNLNLQLGIKNIFICD
uniref:Focal_AT domain-containing protein n=1 Tax=Elaeophora elaphi TaxID=1147741 RepID=A0A0R3RN82_9BILA